MTVYSALEIHTRKQTVLIWLDK